MQIVSLGDKQFAWNVKAYFAGKMRKNIIYLSSDEFLQRAVKVKRIDLVTFL